MKIQKCEACDGPKGISGRLCLRCLNDAYLLNTPKNDLIGNIQFKCRTGNDGRLVDRLGKKDQTEIYNTIGKIKNGIMGKTHSN